MRILSETSTIEPSEIFLSLVQSSGKSCNRSVSVGVNSSKLRRGIKKLTIKKDRNSLCYAKIIIIRIRRKNLMAKIDSNNFNNKAIKGALKQDNIASKYLYLNSDIAKTSSVLTGVSALQNAFSVTNFSNIAINAMRSNLEQINQVINQSTLKSMTDSISTLSNIQLESIKNLNEATQQAFRNVNFDYSRLLSQLAEALKKLPKPYTDEEVDEIILNIKALAEKGWVIYFYLDSMYQRIESENITELENEWVLLLEEVLSDDTKIQSLQESECYSCELIKSMLDCYFCENYYAAYTLATLAIDGAVNRISELKSNENRIPVGYKAVKKIDNILDKTFNDIGLFHWMYEFFEDTNRFTLDRPNRHMVGHGRWNREISKVDFLKLFNVILYIEEEFPYWRKMAVESSLEAHP